MNLDDVKEWLKPDWLFPQCLANKKKNLWKIFTEWRLGDDNRVRCNMSEMLGMYSLVRLLLEHKVPDAPERAAAKQSFGLCCRLVDIFQATKFRILSMSDAADLITSTHTRYMIKHIEAYGTRHVRPKFHWIIDLVDQIRRDPQLFDQLIVERLHLLVKEIAVNIDNKSRWERSILSRLLLHHIQDARLLEAECRLVVPQRVTRPDLPNAEFARGICVRGMKISLDDVVAWGRDLGKVVACGRDNGAFFIAFEVWEEVPFKL